MGLWGRYFLIISSLFFLGCSGVESYQNRSSSTYSQSDSLSGEPDSDSANQAEDGSNPDNGNSIAENEEPSRVEPTPIASEFSCLSDEMLNLALSQGLIWFDQDLSGGAHSWTFHYAEVALAVHAACGDTRADARLLQHIRNVLKPGNGTTAQGGYADQHQVGILTAFSLISKIPRLWNQLSSAEKNKIDLMFEAALVSNAFVTSNENPFVKAGGQQYSMDGGTNFNRNWNPNFRAGNMGSVIIATSHFGVTEAKARLKGHNHASFISRLKNVGLTNLVKTYESSNNPSNTQIETTLHKEFSYFTVNDLDPLALFNHLASYTYGKDVFCGLNDNDGITKDGVTGGRMAKNCSLLPNKGKVGMLHELNSADAGGPRSSASYAFEGLRPVNTVQVALIANGYWQDNAMTQALVNRMKVGIEDLYFKIDPARGGGYYAYAKGKAYSNPYTLQEKYGHELVYEVISIIGMEP